MEGNKANVNKILYFLAILYKSLPMVFGSGGSDETGWKPGLLILSSSVIFPHRTAFVWVGGGGGGVDAVKSGPKERTSQTRTILEQ